MRVLVTGGGGFIGCWIVKRLLAAGAKPRIFDLGQDRRLLKEIAGTEAEKLEWVVGDIADTDRVSEAARGCDAIIHLAGLLTPACLADPVKGALVNLIGQLNVLMAAREQNIGKVVYMSSTGVYGPEDNMQPRPTTLYGAFKLAAEQSAKAFFLQDGVPSIGFRPYVVYGPGRELGLSAGPTLACRAAAEGRAYVLPITGRYDLIHVDDVARAFELALGVTAEDAEVVNLFGGERSSQEVLAAIRSVVPDAEITIEGAPMPIAGPSPDGGAARLLPRWSARSPEAGIADTIAYYRQAAGTRR